MFLRLSRIWAGLVLALLFILHILGRIFFFWRKKKGIDKFFEYYTRDGIFAVDVSERAAFPSFQRCQACSLCTFSCVAIREGKAPAGFEPKFILLGLGRSTHESEFFLEEWLPCADCASCEVICPNQVPVHGMANQIIERRRKIKFREGI